jgi:hypothetical protein
MELMTSKSSVAVDLELRRKIKRLAAKLDLSQGDIIRIAIADFENRINQGIFPQQNEDLNSIKIKQDMHKFTQLVWEEDKEVKQIQEKLNSPLEDGTEIDLEDIIIRNWKTGLEE